MVKKLSRDQNIRLRLYRFEFVQAYEKLIFMIDSGAKDLLEKADIYYDRDLFAREVVNAVYRASNFYTELTRSLGVLYNITYDIDFETGIIAFEKETDENLVFDPVEFMISSAGFNDEWKERIRKIYENYPTE